VFTVECVLHVLIVMFYLVILFGSTISADCTSSGELNDGDSRQVRCSVCVVRRLRNSLYMTSYVYRKRRMSNSQPSGLVYETQHLYVCIDDGRNRHRSVPFGDVARCPPLHAIKENTRRAICSAAM